MNQRTLIAAFLCCVFYACGQGGSLTGQSGKRTADSRGSRSGNSTKTETPKNQTAEKSPNDGTSTPSDDTNDEESRVMAPEVISAAYLTCGKVDSKQTAPADTTYFGCVAFDANKQRLDLKNVKVSFVLKDKAGQALAVEKVSLPDADKDVVWAVPNAIYDAGVSPEADFGAGTTPVARKCFVQVNQNGQLIEQEAQCSAISR